MLLPLLCETEDAYMSLVYGQSGSGPQVIRVADTYKNYPRTALGAGATATVWTPASGSRVRPLWWGATASGATVLTFKVGSDVIFERDFASAGACNVALPLNGGYLGAVNAAFTVTTTGAVTVGVSVSGTEE